MVLPVKKMSCEEAWVVARGVAEESVAETRKDNQIFMGKHPELEGKLPAIDYEKSVDKKTGILLDMMRKQGLVVPEQS